jgi:MoaA/NifB/PqqE/SkfB family radical SAM enzyme
MEQDAFTPDQATGTSRRPLRGVFLHVTKACNLRCEYCYFSARLPMPDEMDASEFRRLWPGLVSLRPEKVVFTGGEPLLRRDLHELMADLRAADPGHEVERCLNTNGHRVTREVARSLVGLADEVRVSLDALPARNDALRGAGNFESALEALEAFRAEGFEPKVLVTVTAPVLPDLPELLQFLVRRGFERINLNDLRLIGRGRERSDLVAPAAEVRAALRRAWTLCYPALPVPPDPPVPDLQRHCGVGRFLNILPNGDVYPCHALTREEFRCGSVRRESVVSIASRLGLLAGLDFVELARRDPAVAGLTTYGACLGAVYEKTRERDLWQQVEIVRKPTP